MGNLQLIQYLFRLRDQWVLPQAIGSDLGSDTEAVHRDLERLLRDGYAIEYRPTLGYRFRPGPGLLDPCRLKEGLRTSRIGSEVHCLLEVPSTMDVAWDLQKEGHPSGTIVLAERQTKGRGRFGRSWESPRGGGIWMSALLMGDAVPEPASLLTVISALSVAEAIEARCRLPARIRWPNDIVIREKKVGGILIEMRQQGDREVAVVVGIGVNVGIVPSELPGPLRGIATSLRAEGAENLQRSSLAQAILGLLGAWCDRVGEGEMEAVKGRWRDLSSNLGKKVALTTRGPEQFQGVVVDLDPIRGLSLDLGDGGVRTFPPEQVTLLR